MECFFDLLVSMLPRLAASVLLFGLGWWLSNVVTRLMRRAVTRAKGDAGVTTFLSSLLNILLKVIISIMAIAQLGVDVTSLIAAIGTAGLAVGLAMKDNMSNVASGVLAAVVGGIEIRRICNTYDVRYFGGERKN